MPTSDIRTRAPRYTFPHTEVQINDNSQYSYEDIVMYNYPAKALFVVQSPRGVDGELTRIVGGSSVMEEKFGRGTFAEYGQPLLNAYAALDTGFTEAIVERICAPDASRANIYIYVGYKIESVHDDASNTNIPTMKLKYWARSFGKNAEGATPEEKMGMVNASTLGSHAEALMPTGDDTDGYTIYYLMSFAATGRGAYGNDLAIKFENANKTDLANTFKSFKISVMDGNQTLETRTISFYYAAVNDKTSSYLPDLINDPNDGMENITCDYNPDVIPLLVKEYNEKVYGPATNKQVYYYGQKFNLKRMISINDDVPDSDDNHWEVETLRSYMTLTDQTFDIILGTNMNINPYVTRTYKINDTTPAYGLVLEDVVYDDDTSEQLTIGIADAYGNKMSGGNEGCFLTTAQGGTADSEEDVENAIIDAYRFAYDPDLIPNGEAEKYGSGAAFSFDRRVYSINQFPVNFIPDAGFPVEVKIAISNCCLQRGDCVAFFDTMTGQEDVDTIIDMAVSVRKFVNGYDTWRESVDMYWAKAHDPITKQIINVPSSYMLCYTYPTHWANYGAKHVPLAGASYGLFQTYDRNTFPNGYIENTMFPVFDDSLDAETMQMLDKGESVNYCQFSNDGDRNVIRANQNTTQTTLSAMTELNNVFIVLDIKRDVEQMCAEYGYTFFDETDLARFNTSLEQLVAKYAAQQVKSITGEFFYSDQDEERGILRLIIDLVHKKLVKICIVDINVNKASDAVTTY